MPPWIRARAVERLELSAGAHVLEVGCSTGRNLGPLTGAVGPSGQVTGIDISAGMLDRAQRLISRRRWSNVNLFQADSASVDLPAPLDGVLFSLTYTVIPNRHEALHRAWDALQPVGHLVIMDARLPD